MTTLPTTTWSGTLTARSSIAHAGETRGTITLLRRELMLVDGKPVHVPIVSGNTLRGRLRRIGEELLRDELHYEKDLYPAAAHALRGGGTLARTGHEPLSGSRLQALRELVPQVGVFGCAGGGAIIDGALDIGKVIPHLKETAAITGNSNARSAFESTQLEPYTRQTDDSHDFATTAPDALNSPMLFHIETFPAGMIFSTWLRLRRPTPLELSFFVDVLEQFRIDGRLGGRVAVGHGQVTLDLDCTPEPPADLPDWRSELTSRRDEVVDVVNSLA